jgi:hypothetical protein
MQYPPSLLRTRTPRRSLLFEPGIFFQDFILGHTVNSASVIAPGSRQNQQIQPILRPEVQIAKTHTVSVGRASNPVCRSRQYPPDCQRPQVKAADRTAPVVRRREDVLDPVLVEDSVARVGRAALLACRDARKDVRTAAVRFMLDAPEYVAARYLPPTTGL